MAVNLNNILPGVDICPDITGNAIERACCGAVILGAMSGGSSDNYAKQSVASVSQAITLFGQYSPAAEMVRAYFDQNPFGQLDVVGYTPTGAASTGAVTVTGTATQNGVVEVYVNNDVAFVDVLTGDTGADVAAAIAALQIDGPVTVAAAGTSANFTATFGGDESNQIQLQAASNVGGLTVTVAAMSGGAGFPDMDQFFEALGECCCYSFIGVPSSADAIMDQMSLHMATVRWGCQCWTGGRYYNTFRGSFAETSAHLMDRQGSDPFASTVMICEAEPIADYQKLGAFIGAAHLKSCENPAAAWSGIELKGIPNIGAGGCADSCYSRQERNVLAVNGLTTMIDGPSGFQQIESDTGRGRINAQGEVDLYLAYPQAVYQTMEFSRLFKIWARRFEGLNISSEEINGRRGQVVLTPNMFVAEYKAFLRENEGTLVENVDAALELVQFGQDPNNPSNASVVAYFDPISALRRFSVSLRPRINLQSLV